LWITRNAMSGHRAPSVRVGGNHGSAVERNGDYFGSRSMSRRGFALAAGGVLVRAGGSAASDLEGGSTSRAGGRCTQCRGASRDFRRRSPGRTADHLAIDPVDGG
jgi:hypothetical protein